MISEVANQIAGLILIQLTLRYTVENGIEKNGDGQSIEGAGE